MTDAPQRIWAQDAEPSECDYIGGGWWDDECGSVQYPHMVEYIRADLSDALLKAERERALREAAEVACDHRPNRPLASRATAGAIEAAILDLISEDNADG